MSHQLVCTAPQGREDRGGARTARARDGGGHAVADFEKKVIIAMSAVRCTKTPSGRSHAGKIRRHSSGAIRGRAGTVRVSAAYAQKAEYIWTDGQEGLKGLYFNEMRSKTKVLQTPIPVGGDFPEWSFDGSRYVSRGIPSHDSTSEN